MLLSSSRTAFIIGFLSLVCESSAVPGPFYYQGQTIPLVRRKQDRTYDDWGSWAKSQREVLITKYGGSLPSSKSKRGSGTNLMVNQNADSTYYGSIAVGTPPVAYNVILDTGSADLWIADNDCISGCDSIPTFDSSASSSFVNLTTDFSITYGSGQAAGVLGQDTIQMAGFSVSNQTFAVCNDISDGLITSPISGLMGLGFETISSSGATPFWQALVESGAWDSPVMTFQLTRFVDQDEAQVLEPGGTFTMGFTNESLYTGDIDYQDIPGGSGSYWILPITELTVQGSSVTLPSGSSSYAAIDTGTTLVGGPSDVIADLYDQIPNSEAGTGNYDGYYIYPCSTSVSVTMSFGGSSWSIDPSDFKIAQLSSSQCLGAFFDLSIEGSSTPSWIVGDTFLKNVYSVFRYNPASVGFANLSSVATAMSDVDGTVPTPTIGSVSVEVTAVSGKSTSDATALPSRMNFLVVALAIVSSLFMIGC